MKKWVLITSIITLSSVALLIILGIFYFLVISGAIFSFGPNPPEPEITYGEFKCRLTYELNGETKIIEDTFTCKFEGFYSLGSAGKYRKWSLHLSDGKEYITLLDLRNSDAVDELNNKVLELYFSPGNAEYYMGDESTHLRRKGEISDTISYYYRKEDCTTGGSAFKAEEAYEKYNVRLISWEVTPPIQNSFK